MVAPFVTPAPSYRCGDDIVARVHLCGRIAHSSVARATPGLNSIQRFVRRSSVLVIVLAVGSFFVAVLMASGGLPQDLLG